MGEYAKLKGSGERVKIGTCEDLLYLRDDHRDRVWAESGSLDPNDPDTLAVVRFRFPFPDEDDIPPGDYEDPFRSLTLWGFEQPADITEHGSAGGHGSAQFTSNYPGGGYLVSLPCPEVWPTVRDGIADGSAESFGYSITKNGYRGPAGLVQQAHRGGRLVSLVKCHGCGALYRLEDGYEEAAAVSLRAQADRKEQDADRNGTEGDRAIAAFFHEIADRLLAGYRVPVG